MTEAGYKSADNPKVKVVSTGRCDPGHPSLLCFVEETVGLMLTFSAQSSLSICAGLI